MKRRRYTRPLVNLPPPRTSFFADHAFQAAWHGAVAVLLVVGIVWLIYLSWGVVEPLIVAIVLATMLWPWVTRVANLRIGRRGWRPPRLLAVALIYLATFLTAGVIVWLVLSALLPAVDALIVAYFRQTGFLSTYLALFHGNVATGAAQVVGAVAGASPVPGKSSSSQPSTPNRIAAADVLGLALGLFGGIASTGLILIFTFFLLLEGHQFAQWVILLAPRERRPRVRALGLSIRDRVSRWVLATAIYSTISGLIVTAGTTLLGLPMPWLYGVGALVLALIPGLGPAISVIPAVFVAFTISPWRGVATAAFGIVLYIFDATFMAPKIFGNMLRLPMFVVFLAILLGSELLGVWGAILALPIATAIQMIVQEVMGRSQE